ncbi:MAG: hypothetical protein V1867_07080 [Candidatus Falkowbacteria bacterium]
MKSNLAVTNLGSNQGEYETLIRFDGDNSIFLIEESAADYGGIFSMGDRGRPLL